MSEEADGEMLTNVVQFCKVLVTDGLKGRYRLGGSVEYLYFTGPPLPPQATHSRGLAPLALQRVLGEYLAHVSADEAPSRNISEGPQAPASGGSSGW